MPGPAVILKELHRLRRHLDDLDTRIAEAPRKLAIQQKRLANQEETAKQAHDHLKNLALQIRDKEGSVKAMQTQVKKYQKQLEEAANKKEYDTLKVGDRQRTAGTSPSSRTRSCGHDGRDRREDGPASGGR